MKTEPTEGRITRSCEYGVVARSDARKITRAASSDRFNSTENEKCQDKSNESNVVEGFLCPICKCDLGRPDYLQVHFERSHISAIDDQPLLNGSFDFRSIISRAKSKVLRSFDDSISFASFDLSPHSSEHPAAHHQTSEPAIPHKQDESNRLKTLTLVSRSRTKMFVSFRDLRSTYRASRSQQVLFRLNRLTSLGVTATYKRRVLERHITPWADDRDISRCPNCAQSFGLLRRKHHCRLCGFIICNQCSMFLSINFALEFLQAVRCREEASGDTNNASPNGSVDGHEDSVGSLKRVDSLTSINSITGTDPAKFIRVCGDCRRILKEKYECLQDQQIASASVLPVFYQQLSCAVQALQAIKANSSDSSKGRTGSVPIEGAAQDAGDGTGDKALVERQVSAEMDKIHSCIMKIDLILKDESLSAENGLTPVKRKIAEALKSYGILAIHDGLTWRGKLNPTPGKAKGDRRSVPALNSRLGTKNPSAGKQPPEADPIVEQIAQVKKFIEIAKNGQRYDEVWALEANLRELELMLRNMHTS